MITDHWTGLELRHLASFRAVATAGTFHGAGDDLGYTQSAVSQHIAALESIVGTRLFERSRGRRTVTLTEAGAMFLRHADAIAARITAAQADLRGFADGTAGMLRIGTYQSVGARILPSLIGRFRADWPGIDVRLMESADDLELLRLVESGQLDLTFAMMPIPDGPFDAIEILRDPYVLVVSRTAPLSRANQAGSRSGRVSSVPAADFAALPLIGYRTDRGNAAVEAVLARNGDAPGFVFRSDDNGIVQGLVAAGLGSAVVPALTVDMNDPLVTVLPTDLPPRMLALAWHRDRTRAPAARAFVDLAQVACEAFEFGSGISRT
jgi:DNA-binding transcriptional LysR family regulator